MQPTDPAQNAHRSHSTPWTAPCVACGLDLDSWSKVGLKGGHARSKEERSKDGRPKGLVVPGNHVQGKGSGLLLRSFSWNDGGSNGLRTTLNSGCCLSGIIEGRQGFTMQNVAV